MSAEIRATRRGPIPYWGANSIIDRIDDWLFDEELVLLGEDGAPFFDSGKSVAFAVSGRIWVNNHTHVLRPARNVVHRWLAFALNCVDYSRYITGSTRDKLTASQMRSIALPHPPVKEQIAIANFLDAMDERIDRYIAAKRKMIALLEEKKQAIINQAVTRGLDPTVPLTPSDIDWLGDIPAHWDVVRAGRLFTQRNETGFPHLPILEVSITSGTSIRDLETAINKQVMSDFSEYKRAKANDLPYNTMRLWQGAIGVAPRDGLVSPAYVVLAPLAGVNSHYYERVLRTSGALTEIKRLSRGIVSDRDRLYWEDFRTLTLPCPPAQEQAKIVAHLKVEAERDAHIGQGIRKQISLVQEYRTRLVSDVVTGKLDLRGVELPPMEGGSLEELDLLDGDMSVKEMADTSTDV